MFIYKLDILQELKKAGYNTARLQREKLLHGQTINDIKHGKICGINALHVICKLTKKQPGQLIAYIPDTVQLDADSDSGQPQELEQTGGI